MSVLLAPATGHRGASSHPIERAGWLSALILGLGLLCVTTDVGVLRLISGSVLLIGFPWLVLYRRIDWITASAWTSATYALGLLVVVLLAGGLVLNDQLAAAGVDEPLRPLPLTAAVICLDLALVWWRLDRPLGSLAGLRVGVRRIWFAEVDAALWTAVATVAVCIVGAIRLNNGASGHVALFGHALAIVALLLLIARPGRFNRDGWVVYLVSAALLLGTSLRGWAITGHDIQREFGAFTLANDAGLWTMEAYQNAYNACLSITIVPVMIHQLTGLPGEVVFKVVLQLLAAFIPVQVYLLTRRVVSPRKAAIGAAVFLMYPTFTFDLPYLVRQEVAYFFVAALLLAASEASWTVWIRRLAVIVFGLGVVLSHYSTTYLLILALMTASGGLLLTALRAGHGSWRTAWRGSVLGYPLAIVAVVATTMIWTGPLTNSGGHLREIAGQVVTTLAGESTGISSSDLAYALIPINQATPEQRFAEYVADNQFDRDRIPMSERLVPVETDEITQPEILPRTTAPLTPIGRALQGAGVDVETVNALLKTPAAAFFQLILLLGLGVAVFSARARERFGAERIWFAIGAVGSVAFVVLTPGLSAEYGVLRAFQQMMLTTIPFMAVGVAALFSVFGRWARGLMLTALGSVAAILLGVLPALAGGQFAMLPLANAGQYYELNYLTEPEIEAEAWLSTQIGPGDQTPVSVDQPARARMEAKLPQTTPLRGDIFSPLVRTDGFVYLPAETAIDQRATIFYTGDLISYRYPTELLDERMSLVYDTDRAKVYR